MKGATRGRRARVLTALVLAAAVCGAVTGAVLTSREEDPAGVFSSRLADDAPLAGDSDDMAARLARQARYTQESSPVAGFYAEGYQAIIKEDEFSVPVYTMPAEQPTSRVTWVDGDGRPQPPGVAAGLQSTFDEVPLPQDVAQLEADGSDGHLIVHQPSTDTVWEFWRFRADSPSGPYTAEYGARIENASKDSGVLPHQWGARAFSLSLLGGVLRMADVEEGSFPYAVAVAVPVIDGEVVPPATRTDGPSSATPEEDPRDAVSAGMRFRLPADYDCDRLPEGSRLLPMLCEAVRDYGMVVVDRTGGAVTMYAEDDRTVGTRYSTVDRSPWPELEAEFAGADAVLSDFPWEDLQRLAPSTPAPGSR